MIHLFKKIIINKKHSLDRKSTRLNSSHSQISYAVFCLKKKSRDLEICSSIRYGADDYVRSPASISVTSPITIKKTDTNSSRRVPSNRIASKRSHSHTSL